MENKSTPITSFVLLGIVEVEEFKYVYVALSLITYLFTLLFSLMVILVVLSDKTLHEPMNILICNLVINGVYGSTAFFPKLIIDLISSGKKVSRVVCLMQVYCVQTFLAYEIASLTMMAYDRYVSICHPLEYITIMTNKKALKLIIGSSAFCSTTVLIAVVLTATLPLCEMYIKNIFCDNMTIVSLSCVDTSVNYLYGTINTAIYLIFTISVIAYSYLRIFAVCFQLSKASYQKAVHTMVTHLLSFFIFLVGGFFVFLRYRLKSSEIPRFMHTLLSVTCLVLTPLFNPVIYGLRTKALRLRIIHQLQTINTWKKI
ncbi:olfactory receptor 6K3-like [Bombina bombina]|uniref:olfactory receptor 6K3-like n=1 Tax=Bombina bombina TaxID=8345 RepID=UPI00235A61F3|nr:olfactory receptor 6K3-like [Bombina bombina]XP_053561600.1 olfactory receptor 6K3-like [Bombina bombina]